MRSGLPSLVVKVLRRLRCLHVKERERGVIDEMMDYMRCKAWRQGVLPAERLWIMLLFSGEKDSVFIRDIESEILFFCPLVCRCCCRRPRMKMVEFNELRFTETNRWYRSDVQEQPVLQPMNRRLLLGRPMKGETKSTDSPQDCEQAQEAAALVVHEARP